MLRPKSQTDPLVEILRLAYRRGLVILRERAEKAEAAYNEQAIEGAVASLLVKHESIEKANDEASLAE